MSQMEEMRRSPESDNKGLKIMWAVALLGVAAVTVDSLKPLAEAYRELGPQALIAPAVAAFYGFRLSLAVIKDRSIGAMLVWGGLAAVLTAEAGAIVQAPHLDLAPLAAVAAPLFEATIRFGMSKKRSKN